MATTDPRREFAAEVVERLARPGSRRSGPAGASAT